MKTLSCVGAATLGCVLFTMTAVGQPLPAFSLDDNAANPISSVPAFFPGYGAEDPYGILTYGIAPGAPSPSLGITPPAIGMDADLFTPGAAGGGIVNDVFFSPLWGQPQVWANAVSDNSWAGASVAQLHLVFSVDRITRGASGSTVSRQASLRQQPSDVFLSSSTFTHPVNFLGTPLTTAGYNGPLATAGVVGSNNLLYDESSLNLTVSGVPGVTTRFNVPAGPIQDASHDNIDALDISGPLDANQDGNTDRLMYYAVGPDNLASFPAIGPADILSVPANSSVATSTVFAPSASLGLNFGIDDIDALTVWENPLGAPGVADSGLDFALFSLSHGSAALTTNGLSEADVFFTDFRNGYWLFASASGLGLTGRPGTAPGDNIDALEIVAPGDANLDGFVDGQDFIIWNANAFAPVPAPTTWTLGDFNSDGFVGGNDFLIWLVNRFTAQIPPVPEPATGGWIWVVWALMFRSRRRAGSFR